MQFYTNAYSSSEFGPIRFLSSRRYKRNAIYRARVVYAILLGKNHVQRIVSEIITTRGQRLLSISILVVQLVLTRDALSFVYFCLSIVNLT